MTATLGDFLTIAGQHIAAAEHNRTRIPAPAHADVITELDRLLTVLARYACDGMHTTSPAAPAPVPTRQELTSIGIRLTLLHATQTIHSIAPTAGHLAPTGHPVAADLRAAAQALIAGRDLLHSHDPAVPPAGSDPLWAPALNARPVAAALMRQLASYAPHLARLTARLLLPAPGRRLPPATREALETAQRWLTLTASAHTGEPGQPNLDVNMLLLHSIPANLPPPRQPPPDGDTTAAELCAGATATATRLRHLAVRTTGQPPWPSPSAAACWQHNALAAAIISHNSELLLRTLAERSHQIALAEPHQQAIQHTAEAIRTAWQACQRVTQAWDPLTTGTSTSTRPSLIAAELDDLVLWIGRLARTGTWTPARTHPGQPRHPSDLARTPGDITIVLVTVGRTTDTLTQIMRQDMHSADQAAAAGWIYSPARHLPETSDLIHIYRYNHASPRQIAGLRAAYHHAITATGHVTTTLDTLLTDLCTPGEPHALARALQHNPLTIQPQHRPRSPSMVVAIAPGSGPGIGDTEQLLHNLNITDPQLLLRAIALDHATRDLTAEALTKAEQLTRLTKDAWNCTACHSKCPRNHSARLAAQDLPKDRSNLTEPPRAPVPQLARTPAADRTEAPSARKARSS